MATMAEEEHELTSLVAEFLKHLGLSATLDQFEQEMKSRGDEGLLGEPRDMARVAHVQSNMLACMQRGDYDGFFEMWEQHVPEQLRQNDITCHKLEFFLQVYFAVQPIHPSFAGKVSISAEDAMARLRHFLDTRGKSLSKSQELLPYYALPCVPDPVEHPSFASIFAPHWATEITDRVATFLENSITTRSMPRLYYMLKRSTMSSASSQSHISREYVESLQDELSDMEAREMRYIDQNRRIRLEFRELVGVTFDLVEALEDSLSGKTVNPEKMEDLYERVTKATSLSADAQAAPQAGKTANSGSKQLELDFHRIRTETLLLTPKNAALLLQALRWNVSQCSDASKQAHIVEEYVRNDILALKEGSTNSALSLINSPAKLLAESLARFLNCLASFNVGRQYILENDALVTMFNAVQGIERDTMTRQQLIGAVQKLTLRRVAQTTLISRGAIEWVAHVLEDVDSLSDYSTEYIAALIMNLCLRTAGKDRAEDCAEDLLSSLMNLLEHDNAQVRTYIHGTLYSVLNRPATRQAAGNVGLADALATQLRLDHELQEHIQYIVQQLNSEKDDTPQDGYESDDEQGEADMNQNDADIDLTAVDDADELHAPESQSGEQLLRQEFAIGAAQHRPQQAEDAFPMRPTTPGNKQGDSRPQSRRRPDTKDRPQSRHEAYSRPSTQENGIDRPQSRRRGSGSRPGSSRLVASRQSGSRPSSGGLMASRPRMSRPVSSRSRPSSTAAAADRAVRSRPLADPRHAAAADHDQAEDENSSDSEEPPRPVTPPADEEASKLLAKNLGDGLKLAQAENKPKPPSEKVLQKLQEQNMDVNVDEYMAAFSTRTRIARTPAEGSRH